MEYCFVRNWWRCRCPHRWHQADCLFVMRDDVIPRCVICDRYCYQQRWRCLLCRRRKYPCYRRIWNHTNNHWITRTTAILDSVSVSESRQYLYGIIQRYSRERCHMHRVIHHEHSAIQCHIHKDGRDFNIFSYRWNFTLHSYTLHSPFSTLTLSTLTLPLTAIDWLQLFITVVVMLRNFLRMQIFQILIHR